MAVAILRNVVEHTASTETKTAPGTQMETRTGLETEIKTVTKTEAEKDMQAKHGKVRA